MKLIPKKNLKDKYATERCLKGQNPTLETNTGIMVSILSH